MGIRSNLKKTIDTYKPEYREKIKSILIWTFLFTAISAFIVGIILFNTMVDHIRNGIVDATPWLWLLFPFLVMIFVGGALMARYDYDEETWKIKT